MRLGSMIAVGAALLGASPASAQFVGPFGSPGVLTVPETAAGAIGAGAAHSLQQQQNCQQVYAGRDGVRTVCTPTPGMAGPRR